MMFSRLSVAALLPVFLLGGCSSGSPLLPSEALYLTKGSSISVGSLAVGGALIGAAYLIYDPLAPNWEIEETRLTEDTYRFALKMKRHHTGGAGESIQILKRRASQLQYEQGFGNYQILEYSEGIDSQTLGARRVADGIVRLVQRREADSFQLN